MCNWEVKTKLAEGKTKIIWMTEGSEKVVVESKDDITAEDGIKREKIENKGMYTTETTCNCFRLLTKKGIANHYIQQIDAKNFLAEKMTMIPIEVVTRRIAYGSYLKRYPEIEEGTIFKDLVVEFFLKDDENHDPLMIWDYEAKCFFLYDAKKPKNVGISKEYSIVKWEPVIQNFLVDAYGIFIIIGFGQKVFFLLEKAWKQRGVDLVDLKVEFGISQSGEVKVADVISNDEWRIWPAGDQAQMKDKQVFRNLDKATLADLEKIKDNYAWVAEQTAKFVR